MGFSEGTRDSTCIRFTLFIATREFFMSDGLFMNVKLKVYYIYICNISNSSFTVNVELHLENKHMDSSAFKANRMERLM